MKQRAARAKTDDTLKNPQFASRPERSELCPRAPQHLVRSKPRSDVLVRGRLHIRGEDHFAAAADAVPERAQTVGRGWAVALEAAALALGCRLTALVQRAVNVPSRCSSAFEIFCAAGSEPASVAPGAWA